MITILSLPAVQSEPPSSSSMCTRMISSKSSRRRSPSAPLGSPPAPEPRVWTMRMIDSSGSGRISRTACSPATRRRASICSPTVALRPGIDSVRRGRPADHRAWPLGPGIPLPNAARRASAGPSRGPARPPPARPAARAGCWRRSRKRPCSVSLDGCRWWAAGSLCRPGIRVGVVGQQELPDRLLGAVAGERGVLEVLRNGIGSGAP